MKVSWGYYSQDMESHKIPWFQSPPTSIPSGYVKIAIEAMTIEIAGDFPMKNGGSFHINHHFPMVFPWFTNQRVTTFFTKSSPSEKFLRLAGGQAHRATEATTNDFTSKDSAIFGSSHERWGI